MALALTKTRGGRSSRAHSATSARVVCRRLAIRVRRRPRVQGNPRIRAPARFTMASMRAEGSMTSRFVTTCTCGPKRSSARSASRAYTSTVSPRATNRRTRCPPTNPVAPLMSTVRDAAVLSPATIGSRTHSGGRRWRSTASAFRTDHANTPTANSVSSHENTPWSTDTTPVGARHQASVIGASTASTSPRLMASTVCSTRSNGGGRRERSSSMKSISVIGISAMITAASSSAHAPRHSYHASAKKIRA